ncbi:MAG: hypothetical protein HY748_05175 [Elusimicrobia bacterium]|nr:hypothetical protein [Elusimicrobiota bacterium]
MLSVNIAALKARLSFYLGRVRQGQEVLVLDRKTPIAKMVPSPGMGEEFVVVEAKRTPAHLKRIPVHVAKQRTDIVSVLREDRDRR